MTAMGSAMNKQMLYLDIISGLVGATLYLYLRHGIDNVKTQQITLVLAISVLLIFVSRVIVDLIYHNFISKTSKFGGSLNELLFSGLIWLILTSILFVVISNYEMKDVLILALTNVISLFAIAG